jgi:uncharacterized protein (DUF1501 family)
MTRLPSRPLASRHPLSRRGVLGAGIGLGATYLAAPALAAAAGGRKLVVIVCRGAMDGLSVAPPIGDPDYAALRGPIAISPDQALRLDGDFALHPKLAALHAMASAGEARIAPAVALPQHIRSHFEAQDLLESGGARLYQVSTGWLNRAVAAGVGRRELTAISIGPQEPLILRGPSRTQSWSPGGRRAADLSRAASALQDLYRNDPLLGPALASGLATEATAEALTPQGGMMGVGGAAAALAPGRDDARAFAEDAARFLAAPGGPTIAVLSLDGFDTHAAQGAAEGQLAQRLANLDAAFEGLKAGLGGAWSRTVVVAATEFGRTARVNGTRGTDHGTASTLILAGGALKPGGVIGDWPTLAPARLFEDRDLAPTLDMRRVFKGVLADHLGLDRALLDTRVFPGSASAPPLNGLVRA